MAIQTIVSPADFRRQRESWAEQELKIGFVPTMGALHEGHLDLVKASKGLADKTVVSIFVNPTQFGPGEDFSKYPRTLKQDLELLEKHGVDTAFIPNTAHVYPEGFQTYVHNKALAQELCGAFRPGHFEGVLTVVLRLFRIIRPTYAVFGKKDYQQLKLIEFMTRDFDLDLTIVPRETVREKDGLAMSSRNRYLSPEKRDVAARIFQSLSLVKQRYSEGVTQTKALEEAFKEAIGKTPEFSMQYASLRRQNDLLPPGDGPWKEPLVFLTAVFLDGVRLIDNIELGAK